jgi:hypothetical protein
MGGVGSGGMRPGSGPKGKQRGAKWLAGNAGKRDSKQPKRPELPAVEEFDAPDDLNTDERLVWMRLAPHAFKARTLTRGTEYQFVVLCRNVVLERRIAVDPEQIGGANHRGILQRIDAELLRFALSPNGKPLIEEEPKVEDPFAEFEVGPVQ